MQNMIRISLCGAMLVSALTGCMAVDLNNIQRPQILADLGLCPVEPSDAPAQASLQNLPQDLKTDPVTVTLSGMFSRASARAQLGADAEGDARERTLSHDELRQFFRKLFNLLQQRTTKETETFLIYAKAYYKGEFVDRFGQPIKKPSLSGFQVPLAVTIADADIVATLTVLLEYLFDTIDPTPIFGDTETVVPPISSDDDDTDVDATTAAAKTDKKSAGKTKFWPGGGDKNRPTALKARPGLYRQLPKAGCGVTQKNIPFVAGVAGAAGDRAALISGLVANSVGGVEIGLGVMGKISIGDNQTLMLVVKTFASRLAMRMAYAGSYGTFDRATRPRTL